MKGKQEEQAMRVPHLRFLHHADLSAEAEGMEPRDPLWPHAIDEGIAHALARGFVPPTLRVWRYHRCLMLGRRDQRLPASGEAIRWACAKGYDVAVRPSGGTGVILDHGVLNVSLILPLLAPGTLSLHADFTFLTQLLLDALRPWRPVEVGEVSGSYCPGRFDLSVFGCKFGGIAQRRIAGAVVVQAFLLVEGKGADHVKMIGEWYRRAGLEEEEAERRPLPEVREGTVRSLNEHPLPPLTQQGIIEALQNAVQNRGIRLWEGEWSNEERAYARRERRRFAEVLQLPVYKSS